MKHAIITIFLAMGLLQLHAQDKNKPEAGDDIVDDSKFEFYDSFDDWKNRKNKHWQGLDIGINGLSYEGAANPPQGYEYLRQDWGRSFYFGINAFEVGLPINGELIKIVTGLGLDFNNIHLKGNSYMESSRDSLIEIPDTVNRWKKNNMKSMHLTVPLILGFNTSPRNKTSWHFGFGAIFSYRLSGRQKVQYWVGDICNTVVRKSEMHQNPFRVTGTLRLGYGNFHIFGNYTLTDYWVSGEGPKANLWVVGLKVIPW